MTIDYYINIHHAETGITNQIDLDEAKARTLWRANTADYGHPIVSTEEPSLSCWTWYTEKGNEVTLYRSIG